MSQSDERRAWLFGGDRHVLTMPLCKARDGGSLKLDAPRSFTNQIAGRILIPANEFFFRAVCEAPLVTASISIVTTMTIVTAERSCAHNFCPAQSRLVCQTYYALMIVR
jgi:hypothetical protein